jgi:hypothetical protein
MLESVQSIFDEPWKPVPRPALAAWLIFYIAFLGYAFSAHGGFLFIDQPGRPRGRTQSVLLVRPYARPVGRHAAAMAGPVSAGCIFLNATPNRWLRFLPFLLFRELALHRHLHGRRASPTAAAGHDRRSGLRGARLPRHLHEPWRPQPRHADRCCSAATRLVWNAGRGGMACCESSRRFHT